jgi:FkbM family methyltransferase
MIAQIKIRWNHVQHITKKSLLPLVATYLPDKAVIIEAGAFDGKDTQILSDYWPHAHIHAFEPVPEIFKLLQARVSDTSNVTCYNVALGATNGMETFYVSEHPKRPGAPFQAGSLLKPQERLKISQATYPLTIQVPTITLDTWANQQKIKHIDFMWLDMQGFELNVLKASPAMLATTKVIYTEVEFIEAYAGQYLYQDVKLWLEQQGFTMIAKDFTDTTTWFFGNALFVRV